MSWSSVLSVGVDGSAAPVVSGFSLWSGLGSLSGGPRFELGGTKGRVLALMDYGDGLLLSLSAMPGSDFSLVVDGEQFAASQSLVPSLPGRARFWWPLDRVLWSGGDEVDVELRVVAGGSALGARAAAPPWAWLRGFPGSHEGAGALWVDLLVSEPVAAGAGEVRGSVRVIGGALDRVQRRDSALGDRWGLKVVPDGDGDVTVWLDTSQGCAALGWWCTGDGRDVHNSPQFTVAGPASATRLASLALGGFDLDSPFDAGQSLHTAYVPTGVETVTVHAAAAHPDATVSVSPADSDPDADGHQIAVASGAQTVITVTVTAGTNTDTYWLVVDHGGDPADTPATRSTQPARSGLSGLAVDGVDPISFDPQTHRYELPAPTQTHSARTHTVVTGLDDTDATVEVLVVHGNDTALGWDPTDADPDTPGHQITLADRGDTLILVRVTSSNGRHQQIYALLIQTPQTQSPTQTPPPAQRQSHRSQSPTQTLTHKLSATDVLNGRPTAQQPRPHAQLLRPAAAPPAVAKTLNGTRDSALPQLASLTLTGAELTPAFAPATTDYTATAAPDVARVTVDAAVGLATTATVTPADADPNTPGHQVDLAAPEPGGTPTTTAIAVAVRTTDNQLNTYTITVTRQAPPPDDEFSDDVSTRGTVAADGTAATGEIWPAGDRDWFRVQLDAAGAYWIRVKGSSSGSGTLEDPYLAGIYDPTGRIVSGTSDDNGGTGNDSRLSFHAMYAGAYYVSAAGVEDSTGTYELIVERRIDTLPDAEKALVVDADTRERVHIKRGRARVTVELEAGGAYEAYMQRSAEVYDARILGIYSPSGRLLPTGRRHSSTSDHRFFNAAEAGTYSIVYASRHWGGQGRLFVEVESFDDDVAAFTTTSRQLVVDGRARRGKIGFEDKVHEFVWEGDRDWYSVQLEADVGYAVEVAGDPHPNPILIGLYDADGSPVEDTGDEASGPGWDALKSFTPPVSGTYYISVGGLRRPGSDHTSIGQYSVSVRSLANGSSDDDYSEDASTTGTVAADGTAASGAVQYSGDRDWFAVTLAAGQSYQFDVLGLDSGGGSVADPLLAGLYDDQGVLIDSTEADGGGKGADSRLVFVADSSGVVFVSVGAVDNGVGSYSLRVTTAATGATGDSSTLASVAVGGAVFGTVDTPGEVHWYSVELEGGVRYRFSMEGRDSIRGRLRDPRIVGVYGSGGSLIAGTSDDDSGVRDDSRVFFVPSASGTHYVAVGGEDAHEGTYVLRLQAMPALGANVSEPAGGDVPADTSTTARVLVGGSVTGGNNALEVAGFDGNDWFAVELEEGFTYRFEALGAPQGLGTSTYTSVNAVFNADGTPLISAGPGYIPNRRTIHYDSNGDLTGTSWRIDWIAPYTGTYYVQVHGDHSFTTSVGTYTLQVTDISDSAFARDDYSDNSGAAGQLMLGSSAKARIEAPGDVDWFALYMEAGRPYKVLMHGSHSGFRSYGNASQELIVGIYDSSGTYIDGTTDGVEYVPFRRYQEHAQVRFTPTQTGVYYIAAGQEFYETGTYYLTVTSAERADVPADSSTMERLKPGELKSGWSNTAGDVDWYGLDVVAGRRYGVMTMARNAGLGTSAERVHRADDPVVAGVYAGDGTSVTFSSDWVYSVHVRDGDLATFVATETGTQYVAVSASTAGGYWVDAFEIDDDHPADVSTSGTVAVGGSVKGVIGTGDDHDWFAVELVSGSKYRFRLEGLQTRSGSLPDPHLKGVYDSTGALLEAVPAKHRAGNRPGSDQGHNSVFAYTAATTGTHYISAGSTDDAQGSYVLRVADITGVGADDFTASRTRPGRIELTNGVGGTNGVLHQPTDDDWFSVDLTQGHRYKIETKTAHTYGGTLRLADIVMLFNQSGRGIPSSSGADDVTTHYVRGGSTDSQDGRLAYTAPYTGTYYIQIGTYALNSAYKGSYTVLVSDLTQIDDLPVSVVDDFAADTSTSGVLAVGAAAAGAVNRPHDRDWFAVDLVSGTTYRFDLSGAGTAAPLGDPFIAGLFDSGGAYVGGTTNDDRDGSSSDSRVTFTASATGTYYLAVGSYTAELGDYEVTVAAAAGS